MFPVDDIHEALRRHAPERRTVDWAQRRAAVALILSGDETQPSLCLIRRAERHGDPWSGHIALPGGRVSPEDPSDRAAAERETREEIGVALAAPAYLGALSDIPVTIAGSDIGLSLSSFVYYVGTAAPPIVQSDEVAETFWTPMAHLWAPGNRDVLELTRHERQLVYPAVRIGPHLLWGLTYRVLAELGRLAGRTLEPEPPHW